MLGYAKVGWLKLLHRGTRQAVHLSSRASTGPAVVPPLVPRSAPLHTPRTHVINLYTPCYLCDDVVRVGSMRFDVLEPPNFCISTLHALFPL